MRLGSYFPCLCFCCTLRSVSPRGAFGLRRISGPVEPDPGNSGGGKVQKTSGSPLHQEGNVMKNTLLISTMLSATAAFAETPVLTVYAPDYFASEWGPGPAIEAEFEKTCGCDLQFSAGDLLPRIMLEGSSTDADIVIGLNTDVTKKARETGLFAEHGQNNADLKLPIEWTDGTFLPFDWAYVSFVYNADKMSTMPSSFEDLVNLPADHKIVIQDPRSSISGLALVLWVKAVYGDKAADYWTRLSPNILTVTSGWSEAYGLFTEGEADVVLSFNTSPSYHIVAEEDETKKAAIFEEGHYPYFELVAKVSSTDVPDVADAFMNFVMSSEFQSIIPFTNWSYPAAQSSDEWPEVFANLPAPAKTVYFNELQAADLRNSAVEEWRNALSK